MGVLNFGSINIDHVYRVKDFVRPGETLASESYQRFAGGKGFNQSIALARAGAQVKHAGRVGTDGVWLRERLAEEGVDVAHVTVGDEATGHAVIQVNDAGENAIVLFGGANQAIGLDDVKHVVASADRADWLLLQHEISAMGDVLRLAGEAGLRVALNPAPMGEAVKAYPLEVVKLFVLNETEAAGLTGEADEEAALDAMRSKFPGAATVLTLGARGAVYSDGDRRVSVPAEKVDAVDTTAAGDTFIGYLLARLDAGAEIEDAMRVACRAAGVCVTRAGAGESVPRRGEL